MRSDSTGRLEVNSQVPLGNGFVWKNEGFYMDNNIEQAMLSTELAYESKLQTLYVISWWQPNEFESRRRILQFPTHEVDHVEPHDGLRNVLCGK